MSELLPPWPLLTAFVAASLALAVTPGPGVLYIVARSLAQGRRAGLASVAGVALGNLGNALLAAWGLAALFAVSSLTFLILKFGGALYLIYLGLRALFTPPIGADISAPLAGVSRRAFRDGVVVALLNPKTMLFFAAFLPQFMSAAAPPAQAMLLGCLFVAIALVTDTVYALSAATAQPVLGWIGGAGALGRWLSGAVLIGLGVLAAWTDGRSGK